MRKLKVKKLLCGIIAGTLITCVLGGCGTDTKNESVVKKETTENISSETKTSEKSENAETAKLGYPIEGNVELTMAMLEEANVTANYKNLADTPFGEAWQEATGVTLKVEQLANKDAMNLLFASGELPDIIFYNFNNYSGGAASAVFDGIILPINDYTEYAPELMAVLESNDEYMKGVTTNSGEIIGFPFLRGDKRLNTYRGMIIREDWLNELDMEVPVTADDLYDVLKAFKEKKDVEYPFCTTFSDLYGDGLKRGGITSAFGLPRGDFYQIDGKVHYGFAELEFKDVLAYLNKLYKEKLLDPNFQSLEGNLVTAAMTSGTGAVTFGAGGSTLSAYLSAMAEQDPSYSCTGVGSLVAKEGDVAMCGHYNSSVTGVYAVITPDCKNVEAAVRFLNYGYTEEGDMLMNWGIEGESYEMVNGEPQWTEFITNNPDGWTQGMAQVAYCRGTTNGPLVQQYREGNVPQVEVAIERWSNTQVVNYALPTLSIDEANASEFSKISGDVNTYVQEMIIKFINGEESLDNFESTYLTTLENMKVKRMIEIQQEALDAYNAR